ncbi:hypothetical protein I4U23_026024 [Adineta vaga]|nr:hypothetical protein I4U23_026024 [Adineta vaga]
MHKIKDVVTKFFHPSFLFAPINDTDRPKRKRSDFTEEVNEEQQIDRTPRNDQRNNRRSNNTDDEPQLTDDEDSYSRDVPSTEQQTKRRRTANYQHILSTNSNQESDRASPPSNSIDSVASSTYTTPILRRTSIEQNYSEIINRSRPLYHHPSTYRKVTSNYDPSKSPLFSFGNRTTTTTTTTTTAQSNETAANHLLATSLIDRSSSSSSSLSTNKQSSGTLTNPISNRRQMFGANYSSINSRRLPYIERLRRRTLQDCIRLDRTLDHEPLSTTTEEPEPTTITSVSKPIKAPEKECGIQCDIAIVEPSQKSQATFPPKEIRNEVVSMPIAENFQTNSSITIEKRQPQTTNTITKRKVLGNITPFSWPKFARAQEQYAKTYPDKCRNDAVVPFLVGKYNVNISSANQSQTNISNAPKLPLSSSRPTESIWQCPCCTKEHSAQTASCSLCYKFNPDYKKPSASQPSVLIAKESVPSITTDNTTTVAVTKESNTFTPVTSNFNKTITKESVITTSSSPTITTNSFTAPFPSLPIIPSASVSITTNENPVTTTASSSVPVFGIIPTTSQQSTITTTATPTPSSTIPVFNTISTITPTFMFGTKPFGSSTTATTTNSSTTITQPSIGIVTTKENPLITTRQFSFGTLSSSDNSMSTSPTTSLPVTAAFQPFASLASTSLTPAVTTSSSVPSIPFVPFGTSPLITTPSIPLIQTFSPTLSSNSSTVAIATTTANTSTTPVSFGFPGVSLASPAFGTSNFTSTTTLPSNNPPFGLNTTNSLRSFAPTSITAVNANNAPTFGSLAPFGTSSMFNERPANPFPPSTSANPTPLFNFGVTPTNTQTSTASIVGGFAFGAQSSAPPLFGATSQSTFPPNLMNFGIQASTSNISDPFKNSSLTADLSSTPDSGPTLFNIGSEGPRSDSPRRILRGRRQGKS